MAVRGAQFGGDGEPALGAVPVRGMAADAPGVKMFDDFLKARLGHMEPILTGRDWLVVACRTLVPARAGNSAA